jgi:hypothetical protein
VIISTQRRQNANGVFVFQRHDEEQRFVCDRCLRPKVARIMVSWTMPAGVAKVICNGCYGRLVSTTPL